MEVQQRLTAWERRALWVLALAVILFGVLTVSRSAFLSRRMGDVNMLFRAGWAARMGGEQLYTITSDNNLHYHYPPFFAYLLAPFADPPPGAEPCFSPPFAVSVGIWYSLNVIFLGAALHLLASMLESATGCPSPAGSRRWWVLRTLPLWVCLPNVGETLNQGQVTNLLLLLMCAGFAASVQGRRLSAGLCVGAAICVKIFPAFLVIGPLCRRDYRCLAGVALALTLGLAVLPAAVYGPARTIELYVQLEQVLIGPALGWGADESRAAELLNTNGPRSQSLVSAITSIMYPDPVTRPVKAPPLARGLHWALGACMTLVTLWVFRRRERPLSPLAHAQRETLFAGTLCLIMLLVCPVSHQHYLMLTLPLVMALVAIDRGQFTYPGWRLSLVLVIHCATSGLAYLPGLEILKDKCLPTYGALLLWLTACQFGRQQGSQQSVESPAPRHHPPTELRPAA